MKRCTTSRAILTFLLASVLVPVAAETPAQARVGSCDEAEGGRSATSVDQPATVEIFNQTSGPVDVHWVNDAGERVHYISLPPGHSYRQDTYFGQAWLVTGLSESDCLGWFEVTQPNQEFVVREGGEKPDDAPPAEIGIRLDSWDAHVEDDRTISLIVRVLDGHGIAGESGWVIFSCNESVEEAEFSLMTEFGEAELDDVGGNEYIYAVPLGSVDPNQSDIACRASGIGFDGKDGSEFELDSRSGFEKSGLGLEFVIPGSDGDQGSADPSAGVIRLRHWSATVDERKVRFTLQVDGGGGIAEQSGRLGYECYDPFKDARVSTTYQYFGEDDLEYSEDENFLYVLTPEDYDLYDSGVECHAMGVRFEGTDGSKLEYDSQAALEEANLGVRFTIPGPDGPGGDFLGYVALGDSFSSGEGTAAYDSDGQACHRGDLGWPELLGDMDPRIDGVVVHRACTGATTKELLEGWDDKGQEPQIPSEPQPGVDLVTLTIGGNDVDFAGIIKDCRFSPDGCEEVPGSEGFNRKLGYLRTTLDEDVYPALRKAYPNARIVHVGYPRLTPAPGQPMINCGWLEPGEQDAADTVVRMLNDALSTSASASEHGIEYLDVFFAMEGHELCTEESWVVPITSVQTEWWHTEQCHPDEDGQRAYANAAASGLGLKN